MNAQQLELPSTTYDVELTSGSLKAVKLGHRRNDAMSWMDPRDIRFIDGFNTRVRTQSYLDHRDALVESMLHDGYKLDQPVSVFVASENGENVCYCSAGHTRTEAACIAIERGAPFTEIPVILLPKATTLINMTVDLVTTNKGRPLGPYETAVVVKRLSRMGLTEAEIGRELGFAQSHVNNYLILANAPREIAYMVVNDEIAATLAIDVMRKHGPSALRMLKAAMEQAKAEGRPRATAGNLPGAVFTRQMKTSAPLLFETAKEIQSDPGYASLSEGTRTKLDELVGELKKLESTALAPTDDPVHEEA